MLLAEISPPEIHPRPPTISARKMGIQLEKSLSAFNGHRPDDRLGQNETDQDVVKISEKIQSIP